MLSLAVIFAGALGGLLWSIVGFIRSGAKSISEFDIKKSLVNAGIGAVSAVILTATKDVSGGGGQLLGGFLSALSVDTIIDLLKKNK